VLKKQDIIDTKIKTIEKLSTTASDITSRLDDLSKQLKEQSIKEKNASQEAPSQNQARNIAIPPTHKAYSGDRRYRVVIFGVTKNSSDTPRASRTKQIWKHVLRFYNIHSIRDCFGLPTWQV